MLNTIRILKQNEILSFAIIQMDLQDNMLSKTDQIEKDIVIIPYNHLYVESKKQDK